MWDSLITAIEAVITTNGNNEITGQVLRELLVNNIVPKLGAGKYQGEAIPSTSPPPSPESEIYYFAFTNGTYSNLGGLVLSNEVAIIRYDGASWVKDTLTITDSLVSSSNSGKPINGLAVERSRLSSNLFDSHSLYFNGVDAGGSLDKDYRLNADGDYVEFRMEILDYGSLSRFGALGKETGGNNQDIAIDETGTISKIYTLKVRGANSTWTDFTLRNKSYRDNIYKIELTNSVTELNLYENGVLIDTQAFSGTELIIKDIATAYSTPYTNMVLHHFKLSSGVDGDINSLKELVDVMSPSNIELRKYDILSPCYVSYDQTASSTGDEKFDVYLRKRDTNEYLGFTVEHELDLSDLVYSDQWRLKSAQWYSFDGFTMTTISNGIVMTDGENETVYKRAGKDDFSGGFHGDEIASYIGFYIDDTKLSASELTSNFNLLACNKFSYNQISNVYTAPTGGVHDHTVEAVRHKRTEIKDLGYECNVRYIWQQNLSDFEEVFTGMCSVGLLVGNYGENSRLENYQFTGDNSYVLIEVGGTWMRQYHLQNGSSVVIESTSSVRNDIAEQKIWDVGASYHKYYRDINPGEDYSVSINDEVECQTKVKFNRR